MGQKNYDRIFINTKKCASSSAWPKSRRERAFGTGAVRVSRSWMADDTDD